MQADHAAQQVPDMLRQLQKAQTDLYTTQPGLLAADTSAHDALALMCKKSCNRWIAPTR
ncbi:MAG: hypothetical protein HC765_13365 [Brachymonas sp.]|nr:hypothetical protein [Brachymonas sp.]